MIVDLMISKRFCSVYQYYQNRIHRKNQNGIFQLSALYTVTSIDVVHVADYVSSCVLRLANNTTCNSKVTNLFSYSVSLFYNLYRLVTLYTILLYQLHESNHNRLLELFPLFTG